MKGKRKLAFLAVVATCLTSINTINATKQSFTLVDGVKVTMSSAEIEAASANLKTGSEGTARDWDEANALASITNTLAEKESLHITEKNSSNTTIEIDDTVEYQEFEGMGSSVDESTVYNLAKMSKSEQRKIIKYLIDPNEGLGMSMFRLTIGSSDFQHQGEEFYTYYDVKNSSTYMNKPSTLDWENDFSIEKDRELGIIDTLKTIVEVATELGIKDEISFFGTAWSLPGWMKVSNVGQYQMLDNVSAELKSTNCYGLVGGDFKYGTVKGTDYGTEYVDYAAKYYIRYLEEYAKEGIDIKTITTGNEPGNNAGWFISSGLSTEAQAAIAVEIKNQITTSTILSDTQKDLEIWALDWNIDSGSNGYTKEGIKELYELANGAIDGIALHDYANQSSAEILDDFSDLQSMLGSDATLAFTERSLWGTYGMNRIVSYLRGGCVNYSAWVTMLDSNNESNQFEAIMDLSMFGMGVQHLKADPTILIQNADTPSEYKVTPEAYMLGQFSKYIRPGYVRIDSTDTIGTEDYGISNVVYKNPETDELVMVVVNNSNEEQSFTAACGDYEFSGAVPAENVATYTWNPNDIDREAPTIEGQDATVNLGTTQSIANILNLKITDNKDGEISVDSALVTMKSNFDSNKVGTYDVKVTASDSAGNTSEKTFLIVVSNTTSPTTLSNTTSPATGDNSNIWLWAVLSFISLGSILGIIKKKKAYR